MNFPVLATLGVVSTILVFVIFVATQAWFRYQFEHEHNMKVVNRPHMELNELRREQSVRLSEGPVPIDQAMQQVIQQYRQADGQGDEQ